MSIREVRLDRIKNAIQKCCKTESECEKCKKTQCLIGFCKIAIDYSEQRNSFQIPNGHKLVPKGDLKVYYEPDLIDALMEILIQCQNCSDNHDEECVLNVARRTVELALLGENFEYEGNAFGYLVKVNEYFPNIGSELLKAYQKRKKTAAV